MVRFIVVVGDVGGGVVGGGVAAGILVLGTGVVAVVRDMTNGKLICTFLNIGGLV